MLNWLSMPRSYEVGSSINMPYIKKVKKLLIKFSPFLVLRISCTVEFILWNLESVWDDIFIAVRDDPVRDSWSIAVCFLPSGCGL